MAYGITEALQYIFFKIRAAIGLNNTEQSKYFFSNESMIACTLK